MVLSTCIVDFLTLLNWYAGEFGEEWFLIGHSRLLQLKFVRFQVASYRQ